MESQYVYKIIGIMTTSEGALKTKGLRFDTHADKILKEDTNSYFCSIIGFVKKSEMEKIVLVESSKNLDFIRYDVLILNKEDIDKYKDKITEEFKSLIKDSSRNIDYYKSIL